MVIEKRDFAAIGLRLGIGIPLLIWLGAAYGSYYAGFWLSWYRFVLELVMPDYRVLSLDFVWRGGEPLIAGKFISAGFQVIHNRVALPGSAVEASTLMGHALLHPIMLMAAVLAWPRLNWMQRIMRLLASLPFLAILETLDVPMLLAGAVTDVLSSSATPQALAASGGMNWGVVLDDGGRLALIIAAAIGAACLHIWLEGVCKRVGATYSSIDSAPRMQS